MNRRHALARIGLATLATPGIATGLRAAVKRPSRILVRSSWQTVNIGDIAHTPGLLKLLEDHLPQAELVLWPSKVDNGVEALLRNRFPKLSIVKDPASLQQAFASCDFLLHGSGATLVAQSDVIRWSEATGKPYGIYGITLPQQESSKTTPTSDEAIAKTIGVLSRASFVYFRDSLSLQLAKDKGCACPVMGFGPDAAFACDLRDDAKAEAFLRSNALERGNFLCCIPRLRYTPYWMIPEKNRAFDPVKHARNEAMKERDHAQLRRAIVEVTRQTGMKILICPEDQTQMRVGKELLYDQLPPDAKKKTVWRSKYWLTGEAISVYTRSAGLFGNEMHSPIMCIGHEIPAIVCRWEEQTSKGFMWRDIGLDDWLFDTDDDAQLSRIVPTVLAMAKDPAAAQAKAVAAKKRVKQFQAETMTTLKRSLG